MIETDVFVTQITFIFRIFTTEMTLYHLNYVFPPVLTKIGQKKDPVYG